MTQEREPNVDEENPNRSRAEDARDPDREPGTGLGSRRDEAPGQNREEIPFGDEAGTSDGEQAEPSEPAE